MPGFVYEGMYLGFLELYYSGDNQPSGLAKAKDVQLITSRAGDRKPFLSPSEMPGNWDTYMLDINSSELISQGDKLWIYYGGRAPHYVPSTSRIGRTMFPQDGKFAAIGLATHRRNGFVSYDATMEEESLTTKPILFELGGALHVNADAPRTEPSWRLRVGNPVEDFTRSDSQTISKNTLDGILGWSGSELERFRGQLIVLRASTPRTHLSIHSGSSRV
ncbi:MAG: hypothetical protein VYC23_01460 [Chloroflexota bacterium]|nr:hypothetical protein [Chloroflexota bacterium]